MAYGRWRAPGAINAALKQADPYAALGYRPAPGSHGTHVMDIAAGNGRGTGTPGMAPDAELLFVQLAGTDIPWEGAGAVGKSFGDSVQLLEAVRFIFDQAGDRPCVVNLSLGTNGGPHDGSTLVEQGLDAMLREKSNRAVILAASNSLDDGIHASGSVPNGGTFDLAWEVAATDVTGNEVEVWYPGADRFAVELVAPDGAVLLRAKPGESRTLVHPNHAGQPLAFVASRLNDPNNHDNTIGLFMSPTLPAGRRGRADVRHQHGVTRGGGHHGVGAGPGEGTEAPAGRRSDTESTNPNGPARSTRRDWVGPAVQSRAN